jgi:hypothetical protein
LINHINNKKVKNYPLLKENYDKQIKYKQIEILEKHFNYLSQIVIDYNINFENSHQFFKDMKDQIVAVRGDLSNFSFIFNKIYNYAIPLPVSISLKRKSKAQEIPEEILDKLALYRSYYTKNFQLFDKESQKTELNKTLILDLQRKILLDLDNIIKKYL